MHGRFKFFTPVLLKMQGFKIDKLCLSFPRKTEYNILEDLNLHTNARLNSARGEKLVTKNQTSKKNLSQLSA